MSGHTHSVYTVGNETASDPLPCADPDCHAPDLAAKLERTEQQQDRAVELLRGAFGNKDKLYIDMDEIEAFLASLRGDSNSSAAGKRTAVGTSPVPGLVERKPVSGGKSRSESTSPAPQAAEEIELKGRVTSVRKHPLPQAAEEPEGEG